MIGTRNSHEIVDFGYGVFEICWESEKWRVKSEKGWNKTLTSLKTSQATSWAWEKLILKFFFLHVDRAKRDPDRAKRESYWNLGQNAR